MSNACRRHKMQCVRKTQKFYKELHTTNVWHCVKYTHLYLVIVPGYYKKHYFSDASCHWNTVQSWAVNSLKQRACLWSVSILERFTEPNSEEWTITHEAVFHAITSTYTFCQHNIIIHPGPNNSTQPIGLRCLQWQKRGRWSWDGQRKTLFVPLNALTSTCFHLTEHGPLGENTWKEVWSFLIDRSISYFSHLGWFRKIAWKNKWDTAQVKLTWIQNRFYKHWCTHSWSMVNYISVYVIVKKRHLCNLTKKPFPPATCHPSLFTKSRLHFYSLNILFHSCILHM